MNKYPFKVFYDGLCVICAKEIEIYAKKDVEKRILFVDISAKSFDAQSEGLDPNKVQKIFHVKDSQNNLKIGVDGFIAIWDELGIFRPLAALAKQPFIRPLFNLGYAAFTWARPFLPRKECANGQCHI